MAYSFNEGSGTTVADSSGNNKNGILVGGLTWSSGKYNNSLDFDGVNDYVSVSNPGLPSGDFTYEAWIYPDQTAGFRAIMVPQDSELELDMDAGYIVTYTNGAQRLTTSSAVPAATWTHVALTRQDSTIRVYLNGALQPETGSDSGALSFSCPLLIGVDSDSACTGLLNGYFDGRIDELRIYSRTLSQSEIQADMNTPIGTTFHTSDADKDGCVSDAELSSFIGLWHINSSDPTLRELMEAIGMWKRGCS